MILNDIAAVFRPSDHHPLATGLWRELVEGRYVVLESSHSPTHCVLELARVDGALQWRENERRGAALLRRLLVGEGQKAIAFSRDVSVSAIASVCASTLSRMGFERHLLHVPYLLIRAAHVDSGIGLSPCEVEQRGTRYHVSVARPDLTLQSLLSATECSVTGLLLQGLTNEAIAQRRNVSVRTIANQLASVYRKLRASGRVHLMCALVHAESRMEAAPSAKSDAA